MLRRLNVSDAAAKIGDLADAGGERPIEAGAVGHQRAVAHARRWRSMPANTSAASAICGTHFGETNAVTSMARVTGGASGDRRRRSCARSGSARSRSAGRRADPPRRCVTRGEGSVASCRDPAGRRPAARARRRAQCTARDDAVARRADRQFHLHRLEHRSACRRARRAAPGSTRIRPPSPASAPSELVAGPRGRARRSAARRLRRDRPDRRGTPSDPRRPGDGDGPVPRAVAHAVHPPPSAVDAEVRSAIVTGLAWASRSSSRSPMRTVSSRISLASRRGSRTDRDGPRRVAGDAARRRGAARRRQRGRRDVARVERRQRATAARRRESRCPCRRRRNAGAAGSRSGTGCWCGCRARHIGAARRWRGRWPRRGSRPTTISFASIGS